MADNCYAECYFAECRYAEYHYAECRYAECRGPVKPCLDSFSGGSQPLPDPAHLHCRADQAVQGQEDRRAAAPHLRHRGQLLHPDDEATAEPVHRHLREQCYKTFLSVIY
jgi:hypothetical protein